MTNHNDEARNVMTRLLGKKEYVIFVCACALTFFIFVTLSSFVSDTAPVLGIIVNIVTLLAGITGGAFGLFRISIYLIRNY